MSSLRDRSAYKKRDDKINLRLENDSTMDHRRSITKTGETILLSIDNVGK